MPLISKQLISTWSIVTLILGLMLAGCSSKSVRIRDGIDHTLPPPAEIAAIPDAIPKDEPMSRYGNPGSYRVFGKKYKTLTERRGYREKGIASWYGSKFHGKRTSSGEPYDMYGMSAAHKTLPLPTYARVTNLKNGRSVVVKINDRGPFHGNRLIDLSYTAAWKLGIASAGTGLVEVEAIDPSAPEPKIAPEPRITYEPRIAHEPSIVPKPSIAPKSIQAQKQTEIPGLFLQVGAFGSERNAHRLRSRLQTVLDTDVQILENFSADQPIFRVQIGPIASIELCDHLTDKLNGLGIPDTRLVLR